MNRIASRALALFLILGLLTCGVVFFLVEYLVKSDEWVIFPGSPHVYNGSNIGCGVVVDREGALLLDLNDGRMYSNSLPLRQSTVHWIGDRFGSISAPSLSYYAAQMAGYDLINGVYNYCQTGGVAELTLSSTMQMAALEAMGEHKGTVAVYNYKTGQLLCAVTTPTYDPDNVPEFAEGDPQYEGLYVNRFLQSAYIPGSIFKIVTMAAALEHDPAIAEQKFTCTGSLKVGDQEVTCEDPHWEQTLKQAFCNSCNCAFAQIAMQMGEETYRSYVEKFGITQAVSFDGITTVEGNFEILGGEDINLAWSSVGQHRDLVNPCAFMTFLSAIANEGKVTRPYLVEEISVNNNRTYDAKTRFGDRIFSARTAKILQEYMQNNVAVKYGAENFPGLTVGAKTGTGEVDGGKKPNAMLAGFVQNEDLPLAFIVCVEDAGYGRAVCVPIASKVLEAAKKVIS
ncbi:MAG: penicillin-binding protein [Oscillospiraceae bacterium]|nr:penicillin-binding protein [Oscillospiraceae bacterium]